MRLELVRENFTSRSTIGKLSVDGRFECFTLEDPVRPEKIKGVTAIPAGSYGIEITFSPRFHKELPLLLDVPEFTGVRIHPGNTPAHTEGCILVGRTAAVDFIGDSRAAFGVLFEKLRAASEAGAELVIEIENRGQSPFEDLTRTATALASKGTVHRVTADVLRLRSKPDKTSSDNVIGDVKLGELVVKRGMARDPSWMRVAASVDGRKRVGYAFSSYLEAVPGQPIPESLLRSSRRKKKTKRPRRRLKAVKQRATKPEQPLELYRVTASRLNLRKGPKSLGDDTVLAALPRGQLVAKTAAVREGLWWEVETVLHAKQLSGFVHSGFLAPLSGALPVEPPEPATTVLSARRAASGEVEVSDRTLQLILDFEGMNQPGKWPGVMSGITIGHGYDLGYCTHDEFTGDWAPYLSDEWMKRLTQALGKRGGEARAMAPRFADIQIPRQAADAVFLKRTIPKQKARAAAAFPGMQALPADCQGVLVSLVYNRGSSMKNDRRREMREIRDCVADATLPLETKLETIARSLESMKRLWPDVRGLLRRRDAEAALVRASV